MLADAYSGLTTALAIAWVVPIGVLVGMFIGAMPGLNASGMLAVLLPVLIALPPEIGMVFAVSLYAGGEVGNSFPAVMLNIPGNASSAVTAFEGYPLMLAGDGAKALGICILSSTFGALLGATLALTTAPTLALVALQFSSVEICIVVLFGLVAIAQVSSGGLLKGLMSGFLGLLMATTGTDPMWGQFRGTFGFVYLYDGLPIIPVLIGLLGFSELLKMMEEGAQRPKTEQQYAIGLKGIVSGFAETLKHPVEVIRSAFIGLIVGIIPGAGTTVASFVSYQQSMTFASPERRKQYGKGSPNGLLAADTANNAAVGGSVVPLLTLGIPGSSTMAVLLVVMGYHNLQVGPRLFSLHGDIAYSVIWAQFMAVPLLLVVGTALAWFAYRLALVPVNTFLPIIAVFCMIGGFAENQYVFDIGLMLLFGVIGYVMKKYDYSVIALLLGVILGPMFEAHLNRGLRMGFGSPELFFTRPIALVLWALLLITLLGPPLWRYLRPQPREPQEEAG